jgi:3-oxosteroid 1-dehydrogenase
MIDWDYGFDVAIVGSGAGGFAGALAAKMNGLEPVLLEKREVVGGSSAMSGGVMWLPNNPVMLRAGELDSYEDAMAYFESVVGDIGPASSESRRDAYIRKGSDLILFLEDLGVRFLYCKGYSDYYDELPGGKAQGRGIEPVIWNGTQLGPWLGKLQLGLAEDFGGVAVLTIESRQVSMAFRSLDNVKALRRVMSRNALGRVRGQKLLSNGASLIGQMLKIAIERNIAIWTDSPLVDLIEEDGRVAGVVVRRGGRDVRIRANHGVLLNAGGFSHNGEMRQRYGQDNRGEWTFANPGDTGEVIEIAMDHGAAVDLMDEAWWMPAMVVPSGQVMMLALERPRPGVIMVDSSGKRFVNEATSYMEVGQAMYRQERRGYKAIPSWLVFDQNYRNRYTLGKEIPRRTPKAWTEGGYMKKAAGLEDLARQIEVDPTALRQTVERFNTFAAKGEDPDFHRGERVYDHYYGDPAAPYPALGPLEAPPFYAIPAYPGDVGTSGGVLTDEHGRVLNAQGNIIPGLYASGNTTASVHGRYYLGPGASVGASAVFSYAAMLHAATEARSPG